MNSTIELIFNNGKKASKITKINPYDNPQPWKYANTQVKQPLVVKTNTNKRPPPDVQFRKP